MLITTINRNKNSEKIKDNYKITQGRIVKYYPRGTEVQRRIVYSYFCENKEYSRRINVDYKFEICQDFEKCQDKRYWVIFSPDNPKNSLINLEIEVQGIENPKFPESLDDFK